MREIFPKSLMPVAVKLHRDLAGARFIAPQTEPPSSIIGPAEITLSTPNVDGIFHLRMPKQSSLADFHKSNGAVFIERDGWLLPAHFGSPAAEYSAVRTACGFIDLSHRGLLQFTGPDRLSFLQGMLSN